MSERNRFICLLCVTLCCFLSLGATVTTTVTYVTSKLHIGVDSLDGTAYNTISYDDLYNIGEPGFPSLPCEYIRLSVPFKSSNFTVQVTPSRLYNSYLPYDVIPAQIDRVSNQDSVYIINLPDSACYNTSVVFPSQRAWIVDESFVEGGNHIVTVAVLPIVVNPVTKKLILMRSIRVTVDYDSAPSSLMPILRFNNELRLEERAKAKALVKNPLMVDDFSPTETEVYEYTLPYCTMPISYSSSLGNQSESTSCFSAPTSFTADSVPDDEYIIVTTNDLKPTMDKLVALKRQKGYTTCVVTMDDVMNNAQANCGDCIYEGDSLISCITDSAGILRQYLRLAYTKGHAKYVLLAGKGVPNRLAHAGSEKIASDLYFSNLTQNWKTASDTIFGPSGLPYTSNPIDSWPHLFVGRVNFRNENDVTNYVDKLCRYELNPGDGNFSYLGRSLYTIARQWYYDSDHPIKDIFINGVEDTTCLIEYNDNNRPIGSDVVNTINYNQFGYWCTLNHGEPIAIEISYYSADANRHMYNKLWARDDEKQWESYDEGNGLNCLSNKCFPMVLYSQSCKTMPHEIGTYSHPHTLTFGDSFILGKDYGGPAYLGNTCDGYFYTAMNLHQLFTSQISAGNYHIGEAEYKSKYFLHSGNFEAYTKITHNILGDPEMEIWTGIPSEFNGISISRNDNSISIDGIASADSCLVSYFTENHQARRQYIVGSNVLLDSANSNSPVMIYHHNNIPFIIPLVIQNDTISKPLYVIASSALMGNSVDSNRTSGDVVFSQGSDFTMEASEDVVLGAGTTIQKGAVFKIKPATF